MQQTTADIVDDHTIEGDNIDDEKKQEKENINTLLDVAFILDCTGSMNPYIESCKDNILSISSKITAQCENCDVQFALVSYRDCPPQDHTFVTKLLNFTPIPFQIQIELSKLSATGGGDQPEALTSGLWDCYKNLKWREKSIKVIIVITDAPPHGLETNVIDGFPEGDIDTFNQNEMEGNNSVSKNKYLNVIEIVKSIRDDLKAAIYSVACEPDLSCDNDFANDFMQYIAQYTKGKFLPLSDATLLPDVIVGSVKQQINLNDLTYKLDEEIQKVKQEYGNDISSAEINKIIMTKWKNAGIKKKDVSIGTLYKKKRSKYNINLLMNEQKVKSLKDFKKYCKLFPRLTESDFRHLNTDNTDTNRKNVISHIETTLKLPDTCATVLPVTDELNFVKMDIKLLERTFDNYIDPEQNGDVDLHEWFLGMQRLNIELTHTQQQKIFNIMNKDKSGFIEKKDFVMFATDEFDNFVDKADKCVVLGYVRNVKMSVWMEVIEIILSYYCMNMIKELQAKILQVVRIQNSHYRTHSSLINHMSTYDRIDYDCDYEMVQPMTLTRINTNFNMCMPTLNSSIPNLHLNMCINDNIHGDVQYSSDEMAVPVSPACAPQRVYARETSLSAGDMEDFMDRLRIYKPGYD